MGDRNPKQRAKLDNQRRAAAASLGNTKKRAVTGPAGESSSYDRPMRFRFNRVDTGSAWCLTKITSSDHLDLINFMKEMESKRINEIVPAHCKRENVAADSHSAEAKKRARDIYPDDHDQIYVLHIDGRRRLWGLLYDNEFSIIWWDPSHDVFPSKRTWSN